MQTDPLARVKRAAATRGEAEQQYRSAVLAAVHAHGYATVARELGVSRQAVRQLVTRAAATTPAGGNR